MAVSPPVRVALLVERRDRLEPWMHRLAHRICASPRLELCAVLEAGADAAPRSAGGLQGVWLAIEARLAARPAPVRFTIPVSAATIPATDDRAVASLALDVVLDLTATPGGSLPVDLARHGIWFTGLAGRAGSFAGLRAAASRAPVTTATLWRKTAKGEGPAAIASADLNTKFIAARNGLFLAEKSVTLLIRELHRLALLGEVRDQRSPPFDTPAAVGWGRFARYLAGLAWQGLGRVAEKAVIRARLRPGMFQLRVTQGGDPRTFDPGQGRVQALGMNAYQADPFLWDGDGERYCFFETFDYGTGKGHISVGRFDGETLVDVKTAIDADYHLSFPFLFERDGQLYMMPESCGARRIEVWRCTRFPDRWERHAVLLDEVVAADSHLAEIDGQWWLFTNIADDPFEEMSSELHLFRLAGPGFSSLEPHPLNPVVFDTRRARNGGRILEIDGTLYRPSQDNSHGTYGYGLNLMRIDALDMERYEESLERKIEPSFAAGLIGCHHLDMRSGRIVIDVRRRIGGFPWRDRTAAASRGESPCPDGSPVPAAARR